MEDNNETKGDQELYKIEEIPEEFFQDTEKSSFKNCTFCGTNLNDGVPYLIEKSIKNNRAKGVKMTVFEYAICQSCSIKKMQAMSKESVANIQAYMKEHVIGETIDALSNNKDYKQKIEKCPVTGKSNSEMDEYSMVGQFVGDKMIVKEFPLILNSEVSESMQDLLSEATKKEFDDFMDTITGIPPELRALFRTNRPILV